jgi:hypothetical protein
MTKTQAKAAQAAGPYIQRLLADEELRANILEAVKAARHAYGRVSSGKAAPTKTIIGDKKVHNDLRDAAQSLREAAESLRGGRPKRKRHPLRKLLLIAIVGAALALVLNDDLRKSVLDMLFGAEEEFEYTPEAASTNDVPAA